VSATCSIPRPRVCARLRASARGACVTSAGRRPLRSSDDDSSRAELSNVTYRGIRTKFPPTRNTKVPPTRNSVGQGELKYVILNHR
jgi:hypothetical protein